MSSRCHFVTIRYTRFVELLVVGVACLIISAYSNPAQAQYKPSYYDILAEDEIGYSDEEQNEFNVISFKWNLGLFGTHIASTIVGFVPEPYTSITAETISIQTDTALKFSKAVFYAPEPKPEDPLEFHLDPLDDGDTDACNYTFTLDQAEAKYENFLGIFAKLQANGKTDRLWLDQDTPPLDTPLDFGVLGSPHILHLNTDVLLSVESHSAGISRDFGELPQIVNAPAGAHNITWRADTIYYPVWDTYLPSALIPILAAAEFKLGKNVRVLKETKFGKWVDGALGAVPEKLLKRLPGDQQRRIARKLDIEDIIEVEPLLKNRNQLIKNLNKLDRRIGLYKKLEKVLKKLAPEFPKDSAFQKLIINITGETLTELLNLGIIQASRVRYQTLTVYDISPPTITTDRPISVFEATDIGGAKLTRFAQELKDSITASDACGRNVVVSNDAPEFFPLGETEITWTVRDMGPAAPDQDHDGDGLVDSDTFNSRKVTQLVTVEDTQPPIMVPPPGLVFESNSSVDLDTYPLGQPLVVDLADIHPTVTSATDSPDGVVAPDTRTVVTWTATDHAATPNQTTATQLVTVKTPGTNFAPTAFVDIATVNTHTSVPIDILLTGSDPDELPLTGAAPGSSTLPDPLEFRIEQIPQNGTFVAPLLPFFINDYRTDTTGVLTDDLAFGQAVDQLNWLDNEYCKKGQDISIEFVYEPLFVHVTDSGEHYFLDHYAECPPFNESAIKTLRISRWAKVRTFLGHVDYNPSGGLHTSTFVLDDDGNIYYLLKFGVNEPYLQVCDANIVGTNGGCTDGFHFSGGPQFGISNSTYARVDSGVTNDPALPLIYLTDKRRVNAYRGQVFVGQLVNDAGMPDFLEDQNVCQPIQGGGDRQGYGMEIDSAGNFYVADTCGDRIHKFTAPSLDSENNLTLGEYVGWLGQCSASTNLACDDSAQHSKGFSCTDTTCTVSGDGSGSGVGQLQDPVFLAIDPNDVLYVADYSNQRIQRFAPDGTFAGQAKSTGNGINADTEGAFILGNMGAPRHVSVNSDQFFIVDRQEKFVHVFGAAPFKEVTSTSAKVTYVSNFAFHSDTDTFAYSVNDGLVDSNVATISVNVARNYRQPLPTAQLVSVNEDGSVVIVLSGSDPDGILDRDFNGLDSLTFSITRQPGSGTLTAGGDAGDVTLDPGTEVWTYRPNRDYHGSDVFSFTVRDAFTDEVADGAVQIPEPYGEAKPVDVSITVNSVNDIPIVRITPPERIAAGFPFSLDAIVLDDRGDDYAASVNWGDGQIEQNGRTVIDNNDTPNDSSDDEAIMMGVVFSTEGLNSIGQSPVNAIHSYAATGERTITLCMRDEGRLEACDQLAVTVENLVAMGSEVTVSRDEFNDSIPFEATINVLNQQPRLGVVGLDASNVVMSMEIPEELIVTGTSPSQGICTMDQDVLSCHFGTISNAQMATVSLGLRGNGTLIYDSELLLLAEIRTDTPALNDVALGSTSVALKANPFDRDGDGLSNIFESFYGVSNSAADDDGDGLDNLAEFQAGTSPIDSDSDQDGISDGDEVNIHMTDPLFSDTDGDGLSDSEELLTHGTDPLSDDTDDDGLPDQWEIQNGFDPVLADSSADADNDGLTDAEEYRQNTDYLVADTDGDNLIDGDEVTIYETDPTLADTDEDGLNDDVELATGTDALKPDSDDDGLLDGAEVNVYGTKPRVADTDRDGLPDGWETRNNRNPRLADYELAAGGLSSCAVTDAGVECWGRNIEGQAPAVVAGLLDPLDVTMGDSHACALDVEADGSKTVKCWGENTFGKTDVPALVEPLQVAAGAEHNCVLDRVAPGNVAVKCWGRDDFGQVSTAPTALEQPVRLVASISGNSSCVLDETSTGPALVCWGQYNNANSAVPTGLTSSTGTLALGSEHGCIVDSGNRLCWGLNDDGQAPAGPALTTSVQLSLGGFHSCSLDQVGLEQQTVACWGRDSNGQASAPQTLITPLHLASGSEHSCALDQGSAKCWGVENTLDEGQAPASRVLGIDPDADGLPTAQEILDGTDPLDPDSDRDQLDDAEEINQGTDPLDNDTDDDGVSDGDEINIHGTNPLSSDTDGDGMPDGWEVDRGLQPTIDDAANDGDADGLSNGQEFVNATDPNNPDSDGDGLDDKAEPAMFRVNNSGQVLGSAISEAVQLGDLDGDDDLDAVVANRAGGNFIWINDGSGLFSPSSQGALNVLEALDVDLGDIDADGDLDIALAHPVFTDSNTVWLNGNGGDPLGTFSNSGYDFGSGTSDAVKFTRMGPSPERIGIFSANWGQSTHFDFVDGVPVANQVSEFNSGNSEDVAMGDVDGDGLDDAFIVNRNQPNDVLTARPPIPVRFFSTEQQLGNSSSIAVALGDLDGDSDLDAFEVISDTGDRIWLNDGTGNFTDSGQSLGNDAGSDVSLFDVDADGDLDAIVANLGVNRIWLNDGTGTMTDSGLLLGSGNSFGLSLADVDGDGDLDAFVANDGGNSVWLFDRLSALDPDSDGDGAFDGWELDNGFDPLDDIDGDLDSDGDGLTNAEEFDANTNPNVIDSDADGMSDGFEVANSLDPNVDDGAIDLDSDGLTNTAEFAAATDPNLADSDGDGMPDGFEVMSGLNPNVDDADLDSDSDGLTNVGEFNAFTNPMLADTDGDGMPDGFEVSNGLNPNADDAALDPDGDGFSNLEEYLGNSDPNNPNSVPGESAPTPSIAPILDLLLRD